MAYGSMAAFDVLLLVVRFLTSFEYGTVLSEVIANFLLDVFSIGITLYLNLKASRQYSL